MIFCLIAATIMFGAIEGFAYFNEELPFLGLGGQIVHGALTIACLILVGVAFWRFGWKIGLLDLLLVFIASQVGLMLRRYFRKKSSWPPKKKANARQ
jgi:UDP-N-acetylmuramyl pentapeptide phosphotransferase/UDP-N-acetylglucosamine-1-phosphate transferase